MTSTDFNFIAPTTRGDYKSWLRDPSLFSSHGFGYTASQSMSEEISVTDPTTLETIGTVPFCNRDDITNAIAGVERAGKNWKRVPARERADCLFKLYQLMLSNKSDLAHVVSFEQGRPLVESVNEVEYAASYVRWYAEECERVYSYGIPSLNSSYQQLVYREPVGPVLAITPWNAPCSMITRKLAPAIAAGCPVILKPSELTPFSALAIYELCVRAGFPDGLFQVLTGDPSEISDTLLNSSSIRKISFTGSTAVGRALAAKAAHNLKRISLELGGNAPFIVRADACMDTAVSAALVAKFRVGGQSCIAANRFLVHRTRVHEFADALIEKINTISIGDGLNGADLGPVISTKELSRLNICIENARREGADVMVGGETLEDRFLEPTVILSSSHKLSLLKQELFGPVVQIVPFDNDDEAIMLANAGESGLAAYLISSDRTAALGMGAQLEVGMLGVNTGFISDAAIPFGGVKGSGMGREGGKAGLQEFLELKYIRASDG